MSDENNEQPPIEPADLSPPFDSEQSGESAGSDPADFDVFDSEVGPDSGDPLDDAAGEEDFEIIFYATVNAPPGDALAGGSLATPHEQEEPLAEEDVEILLPAWSGTTVASRLAAPRAIHSETKAARPRWYGCLIGIIAAVIVFSLLGSSLASVFWFLQPRSERVAEVAAAIESSSLNRERGASKPSQVQEEDIVRPVAASAAFASDTPVNRIVFVNENRQVETMMPNGSGRRALTSDAKSYSFPVWSPDGGSIAAIGNGLDGAGVYVMPDEEASGAPEAVYSSESAFPFYLYWSPDNSEISFLANNRMAGLSMNIVDAAGAEDYRTVALGSPMYWNWTADSRQLLLHSGDASGDSQLILVDSAGRQQAPQIPSPGPFQAPGVSANGRYWAYSQYRAGGTAWLVVEDRQNGSDQSRRHAGTAAFSWSPNRDELAFISGENDTFSTSWGPLRLMDAASGEMRLLSPNTVVAFFWSPDGDKILTISIPPQNELGEQFEVRNQKERRLARLNGPAPASAAAQMHRHAFQVNVIDVESGQGLSLLETALSPIFMTQFLPYFDQYALSHQIWSPDSATFILPIVVERQSEITAVNARNGRTDPLAEGTIAFWSRQ